MSWLNHLNPLGPYKKEPIESWNTDAVKKWKDNSAKMLKSFFLQFKGTLFDEYNLLGPQIDHLRFRILFALYGPPQEAKEDKWPKGYKDYPSNVNIGYSFTFVNIENAVELPRIEHSELCTSPSNNKSHSRSNSLKRILLENELPAEFLSSYNDTQKEAANYIIEQILCLHNSNEKAFIGITFISCKEDENEFIIPIFYVLEYDEDPLSPTAKRQFIDNSGRVYKDWKTWRVENRMPMLKYAIPANGFFTTGKGLVYEFNPEGEIDIIYENSPACSATKKLFNALDNVSMIGGLACGVITGLALFTPVAPLLFSSTALMGAGFAGYGTIRGGLRIYDKNAHKEKMMDLEGGLLILSIISAPFSLASQVETAMISAARLQTQIGVDSLRMFTAILHYTSLSVDSVLFCLGLANLIDKSKHDLLRYHEVLHFSMSIFFYSNTLVDPRMVEIIIIQAQDSRIQRFALNLCDKSAQETLDKFIVGTRNCPSLSARSRIVRSFSTMKDVSVIFGSSLDTVKHIRLPNDPMETLFVKYSDDNSNTTLKKYLPAKNDLLNDNNSNESLNKTNINNEIKESLPQTKTYEKHLSTEKENIGDESTPKPPVTIKKSPKIAKSSSNKTQNFTNSSPEKKIDKSNNRNPYRKIINIRNDRDGKQIKNFYHCSNILNKVMKENKCIIIICQILMKMFKIDKSDLSSILELGSFVMGECKRLHPESVIEASKLLWSSFEQFRENILNDLRKANRLAKKKMLCFHEKFKLLQLYRKYGTNFVDIIQNEPIYISLEALPEEFEGLIIRDTIRVAEVENNIHRQFVSNRLGKNTITLKNFIDKERINPKKSKPTHQFSLFDLVSIPKVRDILLDLPQQVCFYRGFTSKSETFYMNIPIQALQYEDKPSLNNQT